MKVIKACAILICVPLLLAGCGNNGGGSVKVKGRQPDVEDVLLQQMAEVDAAANADPALETERMDEQDAAAGVRRRGLNENAPEPTEAETGPLSMTEGIDIDLTALSSTMVYSEVYRIMMDPEQYLGKTIRMGGACMTYHDNTDDKDYYACVIQDATACCAQGIEFVLSDAYSVDDYPSEGDEVVVTGTFDRYPYMGDGYYYTLADATLESVDQKG